MGIIRRLIYTVLNVVTMGRGGYGYGRPMLMAPMGYGYGGYGGYRMGPSWGYGGGYARYGRHYRRRW